MATRGHLGGLALATPEAIRVLDAAGKRWILVETVGVGQVEVEIAAAADTTVVVVTPGWGDSVQTSKAGLLEIADVLVVNKADRNGVDSAVRDLVMMLELSGDRPWVPPIVETVATEDRGVSDLLDEITRHRAFLEQDDRLAARRIGRLRSEMHAIVVEQLSGAAADLCTGEQFDALVVRVADRSLDPYAAVEELLDRS